MPQSGIFFAMLLRTADHSPIHIIKFDKGGDAWFTFKSQHSTLFGWMFTTIKPKEEYDEKNYLADIYLCNCIACNARLCVQSPT